MVHGAQPIHITSCVWQNNWSRLMNPMCKVTPDPINENIWQAKINLLMELFHPVMEVPVQFGFSLTAVYPWDFTIIWWQDDHWSCENTKWTLSSSPRLFYSLVFVVEYFNLNFKLDYSVFENTFVSFMILVFQFPIINFMTMKRLICSRLVSQDGAPKLHW